MCLNYRKLQYIPDKSRLCYGQTFLECLPWLSEQLTAVIKTFITLAGFFCWPLQTLLPVEINKTWPLLGVTNTSQNTDLLKAARPAICLAKPLDVAVVLCCLHWCLHSISLLLLHWMNTVGQWVLWVLGRWWENVLMGVVDQGRLFLVIFSCLGRIERYVINPHGLEESPVWFFWLCSQIISNVGLSPSRVHHWTSPKLLTTLGVVPLPGDLLSQFFKCFSS